MKPSRYNLVLERFGNIFLFNALSGAFIRFNKIRRKEEDILGSRNPLTPIAKEPTPIKWPMNDVSNDTISALIKGRFVIENDFDELQYVRVLSRIKRFGNNALSLTILTTLKCNFQCTYCYEDKNQGVMSTAVQEKIEKFVLNQFPNLQNLGVTWFGGEPLIGLPVIERLSKYFQDLCNKHNAVFHANIITNGYLLNRNVAKSLVSLGINSAQITLDGVERIHNSRRPLRGGEGTFKKILENILDSCDLLSIVVRMNLDHNNSGNAEELIDLFANKNLQGKIRLSFAPVHNEGVGCRNWDAKCQGSLFNIKEFSEIQTRLNTYAFECGFPALNYPRVRQNACGADLMNSYVIEPNGMLKKCWQTVCDKSESIGDVFSGTPFLQNLIKWLDYDPFSIKKCTTCKVLPLCMGWCPNKIMTDNSDESCIYLKHTLLQDIQLFYENNVLIKTYENFDKKHDLHLRE